MYRVVKLFAFIGFALADGLRGAMGAANPPEGLSIGDPAPDFNLRGIDGRDYSLKDFADAEVLAIVFTCNHCPTAQAYEERIIQLTSDHRDKGVAVICISPNDPKAVGLHEMGFADLGDTLEDMKQRARDKGFNFPYLYDGDEQAAGRAYGAVATPHIFIFDRRRALRYVGRIDDSEDDALIESHDARNAIEALLAGKPVPVERTKPFGCSIKWSEKREAVKRANEKWTEEPVVLETIDEAGVEKLVANKSGKLRLLNVWGTLCAPCVAEFPDLVTIGRMYRKREFELVTLSLDVLERRDTTLGFLQKQNAAFTNYILKDMKPSKLVEVLDPQWQGAAPYTMLIGPDGDVLYRQMGRFDPAELKKTISNILGHTYNAERMEQNRKKREAQKAKAAGGE
jgi:thiol-disulfide isomerase/thioredoxin